MACCENNFCDELITSKFLNSLVSKKLGKKGCCEGYPFSASSMTICDCSEGDYYYTYADIDRLPKASVTGNEPKDYVDGFEVSDVPSSTITNCCGSFGRDKMLIPKNKIRYEYTELKNVAVEYRGTQINNSTIELNLDDGCSPTLSITPIYDVMKSECSGSSTSDTVLRQSVSSATYSETVTPKFKGGFKIEAGDTNLFVVDYISKGSTSILESDRDIVISGESRCNETFVKGYDARIPQFTIDVEIGNTKVQCSGGSIDFQLTNYCYISNLSDPRNFSMSADCGGASIVASMTFNETDGSGSIDIREHEDGEPLTELIDLRFDVTSTVQTSQSLIPVTYTASAERSFTYQRVNCDYTPTLNSNLPCGPYGKDKFYNDEDAAMNLGFDGIIIH